MREGELSEGIPLEPVPEKRIIRKPTQFLHEVGITDFRYEDQEDGVHFFILVPPEHIAQRERARTSILNAPDPTDFVQGPLLDFRQKINGTRDMVWEWGKKDDTEIEIIISKARRKADRKEKIE